MDWEGVERRKEGRKRERGRKGRRTCPEIIIVSPPKPSANCSGVRRST